MVEGLVVWYGELEAFLVQPFNIYSINKLVKKSLGDWSDGGTPGYIPNPEVKPVSADGTWGAAPWESRSLPRGFFDSQNPPNSQERRGLWFI